MCFSGLTAMITMITALRSVYTTTRMEKWLNHTMIGQATTAVMVTSNFMMITVVITTVLGFLIFTGLQCGSK